MFFDIKNREVKFYDFHSPAAKDLISQLLVKDPEERLSQPEIIMRHDFYLGVNWDELMLRKTPTPYKPVLKDPTDTSHFDAQ